MADKKPETVEEYRALLLSLCGSLTLCDHMGDVSSDVDEVLKRIGVDLSDVEWEEMGEALGKMGVTTLYGTTLYDPREIDADEEDETDD